MNDSLHCWSITVSILCFTIHPLRCDTESQKLYRKNIELNFKLNINYRALYRRNNVSTIESRSPNVSIKLKSCIDNVTYSQS